MPSDIAMMARESAESIRTGAFHPFTGPIYNQAGELMIPAGEVAADFPMLAQMNWYVQGIDDKLPE
jgi:simple sugar transport system substrate-binding protein